MTFAQICKLHKPDRALQFTHPDLRGIMTFTADGLLVYAVDGRGNDVPLWLSDFDRDDWHTVS